MYGKEAYLAVLSIFVILIFRAKKLLYVLSYRILFFKLISTTVIGRKTREQIAMIVLLDELSTYLLHLCAICCRLLEDLEYIILFHEIDRPTMKEESLTTMFMSRVCWKSTNRVTIHEQLI